ncbi:hypothetical protein GGD56_003390 [Rhizobium mongolense]|uniref:Uncharacterized protein n=1 Tax=Rhizobium mongolense TaxID=57676 RepID=A0ABR6INS7_9HYPH|nr:hypothetical protein [Rhizobium mongolense]
MDQNAVDADAGLAAIAELRGDCTLDGKVEICVIEGDGRRVAAEFQAPAG